MPRRPSVGRSRSRSRSRARSRSRPRVPKRKRSHSVVSAVARGAAKVARIVQKVSDAAVKIEGDFEEFKQGHIDQGIRVSRPQNGGIKLVRRARFHISGKEKKEIMDNAYANLATVVTSARCFLITAYINSAIAMVKGTQKNSAFWQQMPIDTSSNYNSVIAAVSQASMALMTVKEHLVVQDYSCHDVFCNSSGTSIEVQVYVFAADFSKGQVGKFTTNVETTSLRTLDPCEYNPATIGSTGLPTSTNFGLVTDTPSGNLMDDWLFLTSTTNSYITGGVVDLGSIPKQLGISDTINLLPKYKLVSSRYEVLPPAGTFTMVHDTASTIWTYEHVNHAIPYDQVSDYHNGPCMFYLIRVLGAPGSIPTAISTYNGVSTTDVQSHTIPVLGGMLEMRRETRCRLGYSSRFESLASRVYTEITTARLGAGAYEARMDNATFVYDRGTTVPTVAVSTI